MERSSQISNWVVITRLLLLSLLFSAFPRNGTARAGVPSGPEQSLQNLGFTLLQATPMDFELPAVIGGNERLKKFRGKWIFLAFWATWCGPCNQEIPELEGLYREFKDRGLAVVAVSVDQDRAPVEEFQRSRKLSFPVLLDRDSAVASKYRASALPTLYVISPDWKLAAVLQGARDWSASDARDEVRALLSHQKYQGKDVGTKMVEENGALSLPNNLAPPQLAIQLDSTAMKKGASVPLEVLVTWKGNPKDYLIKVPKLTLPEGITQGDVSSSSSSQNESTTLQYHFPLKVEKTGSFKIGPIELAYLPRAGGKELYSRNEGLTVEVREDDWKRPILIGGAVLVGILLIGGIFLKWRTHSHGKTTTSVARARRDWSEPYEKIRQLKMRGSKNEYIAELLKLNLRIDEESGTKNPTVVSLLEKLQFGGQALSDTELASFEKKIERVIKESP